MGLALALGACSAEPSVAPGGSTEVPAGGPLQPDVPLPGQNPPGAPAAPASGEPGGGPAPGVKGPAGTGGPGPYPAEPPALPPPFDAAFAKVAGTGSFVAAVMEVLKECEFIAEDHQTSPEACIAAAKTYLAAVEVGYGGSGPCTGGWEPRSADGLPVRTTRLTFPSSCPRDLVPPPPRTTTLDAIDRCRQSPECFTAYQEDRITTVGELEAEIPPATTTPSTTPSTGTTVTPSTPATATSPPPTTKTARQNGSPPTTSH